MGRQQPGQSFLRADVHLLNDFNIGGGALRVVYSDNGTTWTPVTLNGSFIRDNQITGDLQGAAGCTCRR